MKTYLHLTGFIVFLCLFTANSFAQKKTAAPNPTAAQQVDTELLSSLKIEANHNLNRLKSLREEKKNNKIYEEERERSLGTYLEDQEKWDLAREKGLAEYRKQKKTLSPAEDGPEYREDQRERKKALEKAEKSRETQVRTRNQILNQNPGVVAHLEDEELGLLELRPRYELRFRGKNKWNRNSGAAGSRSSGGGSTYTPPNDLDSGFPPPPLDYTPAPPPMDSYEEVPPPPPPPGYDYGAGAGMPYDSGYGDVPPPPPPPPMDYDF